jgi:hypothetical protein
MTALALATLERVPFESIVPAADTLTIDTPHWVQVATPSLGDSSLNGVYLAKLAPAQADARIAELVRAHDERDAEFRWFVGPSSTPADLPDRLRRAGFVELGTSLGMVLPVPREPPPVPSDITLCEVGEDELDEFVRVSMLAWSRDAAFGHALMRALRRGLAHAPGLQRSWLVTRGGEGLPSHPCSFFSLRSKVAAGEGLRSRPCSFFSLRSKVAAGEGLRSRPCSFFSLRSKVAAGESLGVTTLRLLPQHRIGYLQGAAVVPAQRRGGLYHAMLLHRLALLCALDYRHAVVWANERSSAQGCLRMGFAPQGRGTFFEWRRASRYSTAAADHATSSASSSGST